MTALKHRLPWLALLCSAALLLSGLAACADEAKPPALDLAALGVPLDQLPGAEALLEAELDRIKAAGEPLSLLEIAPPEIPAAENAALIYAQAFAALQGELPGTTTAPTLLPAAGAAGPPPGADEAPPSRTADEAYVAQNQEALALLEKAAAMPKCRFPVDWSAGFAAAFPQYARLRGCAVLLRTAALVEARRGHPDRALQLCGVGLSVGNTIQDDPVLIADLVRYAVSAIALSGLRGALGLEQPGEAPALLSDPPPPAPSTAACQTLLRQLAQAQLVPSFRRALLGERACGLAQFTRLREAPEQTLGTFGDELPARLAEWGAFIATTQGEQLLALDELAYLRATEQMLATADRPWREMAAEPQPPAVPAYAVLSRGWLPTLSRVAQRRDRCLAEIGQAQIALALVACHNETGEWPGSLDQLRRIVKWELPLDPFSGKDFVYRRDDEGWVLYSIGPDLKDDGGAALSMDKWTGDLTWRTPTPR